MKVFHNLLIKHRISENPLILNDKEDEFIAAIEKIIPLATHMLCQWRIHKNIMRITKDFRDDAEGLAAYNKAWFAGLNARPESEYMDAEIALLFLESTGSSEALFPYIEKEWLKNDNKNKFVKAWTDKNCHFDHQGTFTRERAHRKLKRRLLTRTGNLKTVVDEVRDLIISEQEEIRIHHEEQKIQLHPAQRIPPLRYLIGIISPVALDVMVDLWKMVTNASTGLELCTDIFFLTMGLPCKHRIQYYIFTPSQPIKPEHCHPQWYLDGTPLQYVDPDPMLLVQEPVKVYRKGRPTNTHGTSTKKNLSQFEIAQEVATKARREKEVA